MTAARPIFVLVSLGFITTAIGCQSLLKKRDPDAAPSAAPIASVAPAVVVPLPTLPPVPEVPPAQAALDETKVPTPQDFEDEAVEKVTPANFRAQFNTLKTDIGK